MSKSPYFTEAPKEFGSVLQKISNYSGEDPKSYKKKRNIIQFIIFPIILIYVFWMIYLHSNGNLVLHGLQDIFIVLLPILILTVIYEYGIRKFSFLFYNNFLSKEGYVSIELSEESFYSKKFKYEVYIPFNQIEIIKGTIVHGCNGDIGFEVVDDSLDKTYDFYVQDKKSIDLVLGAESIITDKLYQKYKDLGIFFGASKNMLIEEDLDKISHLSMLFDGIYFSPNNEVCLFQYQKQYILKKNTNFSILVEDGIIVFILRYGRERLKISLALSDFINTKLLLILLSERLDLDINKLLENRHIIEVCGGGGGG